MDAPKRGFVKNHPIVANAVLQSIHYVQQFNANFCFWTNAGKSRGATGDPANRLYSVLLIVPWQVIGDWAVTYPPAPAGGPAPVPVLAVVTPHSASTGTRTTLDLGRAEDNGVEVRPPSGITQVIVWDGSA